MERRLGGPSGRSLRVCLRNKRHSGSPRPFFFPPTARVRPSVSPSVLVTEPLLCAALWWAVFGAASTPPLSKHGPVDHESMSDAALGGEAAHREPRRSYLFFTYEITFPAQSFNKLKANSPCLCFGLGGEFGHGALLLWIQSFGLGNQDRRAGERRSQFASLGQKR